MNPADAKVLQKSFSCPVCYQEFKSPRVRMTKTRLYQTDTDLRPYYEGIDVVCYEIITCTHCGYSAIEKTFDNVTPATRENILNELKKHYVQKEFPEYIDVQTAIERYVLALISAMPKKAKKSEFAYLYLKLSWLYRVQGNEGSPALEKRCQVKFIELAELTFFEEVFPVLGFEEEVFLYLIAEVSRRIKDYEKANKYIGKVLLNRNISDQLRVRAEDVKELIYKERKEAEKQQNL